MKLERNRDFEYLIPALSKHEHEALIASIRSEGCRQPITIWKGKNIIVDGYNRYDICNEFNIPFEIEEMEFEDEYRVKIWMINNQFARRNLGIEHLADLAYKLAEVEQELAEKRKLSNLKQNTNKPKTIETSQSTDSLTGGSREIKGKAFEKAAQKAGISRSTVERYDAIQRKGTNEQKEAIKSGQKKIGTVYKEIQAKEKPLQKSQSNECDIEKLLKNKTINNPYLLIYLKRNKETDKEEQAEQFNCPPNIRLKMCADSFVNSASSIITKDYVNLVKLTMGSVIQESKKATIEACNE